MSHRRISSLTKLPQENNWVPEKLSASRWAPGGMEDQAMDISEPLNEKTPTPANNNLASSRWAVDSADPSQTGKKTAKAYQKNKNKNKKNHQQVKKLNSTSNQSLKNTNNHEAPSVTTEPTAQRVIGPLSQEEKEVKMENPFFDPTKHKGLSSSRWANE